MISTEDLLARLPAIVGSRAVLRGEAVTEELTHDEGLVSVPIAPLAVVMPATTAEVAGIVALAREARVPLTARGSATGLSGGCVPTPGGLVVSFARMKAILEIDESNHVAVVQPGLTLDELESALRPKGLVYPVYPGDHGSSLGGNVNTNAGGMRAVRYGVTRHNVLGLEMVLGTGEIVRSGGRYVKSSTGYDLTQIVIGSEGTLALVTEVTLKLQPLYRHSATVLAPFSTLPDLAAAVPTIIASGLTPSVLEYIDTLTMSSITASEGLDLGIPQDLREAANAYVVVVLEQRTPERVNEDVETLGMLLADAGALEVFVLPGQAGGALIRARERAFFVAKASGANEIIDVVVPRDRLAVYLEAASKLAAEHGCFCVGCGHAGDGNVHLSVFQPEARVREEFLLELFRTAMKLGGAISGEHGIGTAKQQAFLLLEDPARIALMRRVKASFDPLGILNPDKVFGYTEANGS
ncbi:MAG TPA: FAD-linked oxidase C-terminal domain-containing protein [Acidimicrobiales bacterium]|nr:FAD-linked oxidase C-terminal domain-containing protein [Acidimicrobiales bacterium]